MVKSLLIFSLFPVFVDCIQVTIQINSSHEIGPLKHLWSSTGFSPEIGGKTHLKDVSILNRLDSQLNLQLIGSLPTGAIDQIRVHWLLDLMTENPFSMHGSALDQFIHLLWNYQLMPGFELMGNPGHFFRSNFTGSEKKIIASSLFLFTGITVVLASDFGRQ